VYTGKTHRVYIKLAFAFTQHINRPLSTEYIHKLPSRILHTSGLLPAPPTRQPITERCPPIRDARPCAAHCWATCYPVPNSGSTRVRNRWVLQSLLNTINFRQNCMPEIKESDKIEIHDILKQTVCIILSVICLRTIFILVF
jgi:hypothetical protein